MGEQIVVGSINLDMVVTSPKIPGPGENICGHGFRMVPGGKGANQAVASTRLGKKTRFLGCVGNDFFGDYLLENLSKAEVDSSLMRRAEGFSSGVALIVVEENTGVNTIVVDNGANEALTIKDLEGLEVFYDSSDCILFQLESPLDVVAEGSRRAKERGLITVLDAGPPRQVELSVLANFDVVSPNRNELEVLSGVRVDSIAHVVQAAKRLLEFSAGSIVVKLGEEGSLLLTGEGAWLFPPYEVKPVDSTAAGDAFTAALSVALGEGTNLHDAVWFANAAGALAVTVFGAQPSMPKRNDVIALMTKRQRQWGHL
ncbi:MAG: PfkB family carbohydrate kinase [Actinomycetota bacterium]|nr:PfkB family carbohydrate kinase [Actinomycetota bacterium]